MIGIEQLISCLKDKNDYKTTTTRRFKADLHEIAVRSNDGDFVELGCDTGNTTAILASALTGSARRLFAFDIDEHRLEGARNLLSSLSLERNASFIHGDIYESDWTSWVPGRVGLVFVDAIHGYKSVCVDIANIRRLKLARDCPVLFHDYGLIDGGVKQALTDCGVQVERCLGEPPGAWNLHRPHSTDDFEAVLTHFNNTMNGKDVSKG